MSNILSGFRLVETDAPDTLQLTQLSDLNHAARDGGISYPLAEEDCLHLLLYHGDTLTAALAFLPLDEELAEVIAMTRPAFRRLGCFSLLFDAIIEKFPDYELSFPVTGRCPDTMEALRALKAQLSSTEYQMERSLSNISPSPLPQGFSFSAEKQEEFFCDTLSCADAENVASCLISCFCSESGLTSACLHHVEVLPAFRNHGYGTLLIEQVFFHLSKLGVGRIVLHVSGDNAAALALYKKTGFHILETLSYYSL